MSSSQNGWPAIADYSDPQLISNPTVPGTAVQLLGGVHAGPAGLVLIEAARRWDTTVEPLIAGACWGYQPRDIRGSATLSNHASGTAVDLNATAHPLGSLPAATLSPAKIAAARSIVTWSGGVLRWGGDYTGRKDAMHYEIVCSPTDPRLAALAATINRPTQPEEIDMAGIADIDRKLDAILKQLVSKTGGVIDPDTGKPSSEIGDVVSVMTRTVQHLVNQVRDLRGDLVNAGVIKK